MLRRLSRRVAFSGLDTLAEYVPLLQSDSDECRALMQDLLISVSSFFRDPEEFEALAKEVPGLFEGKGAKDTVRVWVAGCATGEEVYSVAILLAEHAATLDESPRIQMFATDIDETGYAWGRDGVYPAAAVDHVDPERLQRFFKKDPAGYRILKSLREMVLFAIHDVLRDPPFARIDLISCRNLFIYLRPEAQRQLLETFHYALAPEGMLFLGASESAGDGEFFAPAAEGLGRIYRRRARARHAPRSSAADPLPRATAAAGTIAQTAPLAVALAEAGAREAVRTPPFSYGALHVRMLERYAPPSVIVDDRWEVVHLSEGAGRFLRLGGGEPSRRILDLVPEELRPPLRTALHQALERGQPMTREVAMDDGGVDRPLSLRVRPGEGEKGARFALVILEELEEDEAGKVDGALLGETRAEAERQDVVTLERDLHKTREQLDLERASHDRTVSDLRTVNEELRSINEEQNAATEELETGREEIQAINEELTTINQEHQSTIEELARTNADLSNLIESTEIGTVFVDKRMRIRRFTPRAAEVFNFADTDAGRPLSDITNRMDYPGFTADVALVLESLERIEREVRSEAGDWFVVRINPYRSQHGEVDGAVLTLFDHTDWHRMGEELREAKLRAESANAEKEMFLATISHDLRAPLGAIIGYADILEIGGTLTEEQKHRVESIKKGALHLNSMIEQILQFARLDSGRETVAMEDVDARVIVDEVRDLMAPLAERNGLALLVQLPDEAVRVTTDVGKTRQILLNLCGNAVKYTETGDVRLGVRADEGRVVFDVHDTGVGIAAEHQELIFERFRQLDGGLSRSRGGLGIGLAAAREYARLLGGNVEVESAPGEGSEFRFWLPVGAGYPLAPLSSPPTHSAS